jgi:hypothetical protein
MIAGNELSVRDRLTFHGTPEQKVVHAALERAPVEAIRPLSQISWQMLRAHTVMSADQPGFDVAENGVDDRKKFRGIGTIALDDRRVLEMLLERRFAAGIAAKAIRQQM